MDARVHSKEVFSAHTSAKAALCLPQDTMKRAQLRVWFERRKAPMQQRVVVRAIAARLSTWSMYFCRQHSCRGRVHARRRGPCMASSSSSVRVGTRSEWRARRRSGRRPRRRAAGVIHSRCGAPAIGTWRRSDDRVEGRVEGGRQNAWDTVVCWFRDTGGEGS